MTERIYYKDPTILEFDASIVETGKKGDQYFTILDKTAFYPTSGGQLYDTGELNNIPVVDVIENNDRILHLTDQQVGETGKKVKGIVNKTRRQMNRQNHSAQHILSQAFVKLYGFETVSVHLGEEYGALELNTNKISSEQLNEIEKIANAVIASNLPIDTLFIDSEDIKDYPLRKIPKRKGTIRIIKIGDFEMSACGGTHCNSTAEVVLLKITEIEKIRKHVLVKFMAGSLAIADYSKRYDITHKISTDMTCHLDDLVGKFEKLTQENREQKNRITQLNKELLPVIIDKIITKSEVIQGIPFVYESLNDIDKKLLNNLTNQVAENIKGVVIINSDSRLIIAVDQSTKLSANEIAKKITSSFELKGGGNTAMAQIGGVDSEQLKNIREFTIKILSNAN